jgi:hypothetical protein
MNIKKLENGNYEITREYLEQLVKSDFKLNSLINCGIDNWEYYDDFLEEYNPNDVQEYINSIE